MQIMQFKDCYVKLQANMFENLLVFIFGWEGGVGYNSLYTFKLCFALSVV